MPGNKAGERGAGTRQLEAAQVSSAGSARVNTLHVRVCTHAHTHTPAVFNLHTHTVCTHRGPQVFTQSMKTAAIGQLEELIFVEKKAKKRRPSVG